MLINHDGLKLGQFITPTSCLNSCPTQSPKNFVGTSALLTGKFLRVRKVFVRVYKITQRMKSKHQLKRKQVWKVLESLESFRTV